MPCTPFVVDIVVGVPLIRGEPIEHVGRTESEIEVERNNPISAFVDFAVCFDVIVGPVCGTQINACRHVIGVFVDVDEPLYFFIGIAV